ncbi:thioredoxin domain-containing protein [Singulisphaera acidiphila]|uniref:Thioredoxin domain-containing protein n=1 Tax=Singulisphaera acidiphila (strain ATCC BAA-1392 / DSM 18658 / VKM B-2454 / MOB10) TaxID=886293 RepID=L0DNM1_SINAD|nr:thioredoxin domain-containing protein [Singulisphaera acidiphila]AGA30438.1 thioredoxin domain-containing protein [Singulisphaera acidiphila DSM 18658]
MTIAALLIALITTPNLDETRSPILLDFQATWCGPCRQMRPAIKQLIDNGYPVKEIDIDKSPDLAAKYQVSKVPTFLVVDPEGKELARSEGAQSAGKLASFYLKAKGQAVPPSDDGVDRRIEEVRDEGQEHAPADPEKRSQAFSANPEPWKTVVRIKVQGNGSIGFGSGTIIHSTAEESIILTCAHIFKVEGRAPTAPANFRLPITIDLFDGVLHSKDEPRVHPVETVKGEAMDYDFDRDVGLIRIRPGRRLDASRVVPPSWSAQPRMKMFTVGCSEGNDATAWSTTVIKPGVKLFNNSVYEAIECQFAPKQGRSGGGLYTEEGYLAGVCDFAEPQGQRGYYATPRSIYNILDRNKLMALYTPANKQGGALLAANRPNSRGSRPPSIARAQSPDSDDSSKVMMPPPELLGIRPPVVAQQENPRGGAKKSWRSISTESTDLKMAPDVSNDTFQEASSEPPVTAFVPEVRNSSELRIKGKWRAVQSGPAPMLSDAAAR